MLIIIKNKECRLGKSRSEIETNLRKEWGNSMLNPEQIDKCKFLEKHTGATWLDTELVKRAERVKKL